MKIEAHIIDMSSIGRKHSLMVYVENKKITVGI
jgi:hypothetical protein